MATGPYFAAILRDASASPMLLRMRAEIDSQALMIMAALLTVMLALIFSTSLGRLFRTNA
jgi:hypothetical protein